MARSDDEFLVRSSSDQTVSGEVWGIKTGDTVYGIAGADGNAERERKNAEEARKEAEAARAGAESERADAEKARVAAEQARVAAERARAEAQARNDADQALNNEAVKRLEPVVLGEGQFDRETLRPTVAGEPNRMYFVPMAGTGEGGASSNSFAEWMFVGGGWELMGETEIRARPLSTADVDAVASGSSPQVDGVLTLTGLSYLWARLAGSFAAASHTHAASEVEGLPALVSGLAGAGPRLYVSPAAHPEVDPDGGWRIPVPASGPLRELASRPGGDVVLFSSGLAMFASPGGWPRHVGMERPVPGCRAAFRCSGSGSGGNGGSLSVEDGGVAAGFAAQALSTRVHGVKVKGEAMPPLEVSTGGIRRPVPVDLDEDPSGAFGSFFGALVLELGMRAGKDTHLSSSGSSSGLRGIPFALGGTSNIPWEVTGGLLEVEFGPAR